MRLFEKASPEHLLSMSFQNRNLRIDNIKGILIFLVVFGHLIEINIRNDQVLRSIWIFIYTFHMPMFALVSGLFSKSALDEKQSLQLLKNIVVPLLAFEIIYEGIEVLFKGHFSVYSALLAPYWMLWYLLSLLCWRLLLPLFSKLQFPVVVAVVVALIASYSENTGYFLSISRTLVFFPFFLFGWKMGAGSLEIKSKTLLLTSILTLATAFIAAFLLKNDFDYRWLYGSYSLPQLGMAKLAGTMYQLLQYAVSSVIGLAFLYLVARKDWGLASIGQRSMYVFLWHGVPLIALQKSGLLQRIFGLEDFPCLLLSLVISALIVWVAAHPWCERLTQACLLKPLSWFLIKQEQVTAPAPVMLLNKLEIESAQNLSAKDAITDRL